MSDCDKKYLRFWQYLNEYNSTARKFWDHLEQPHSQFYSAAPKGYYGFKSDSMRSFERLDFIIEPTYAQPCCLSTIICTPHCTHGRSAAATDSDFDSLEIAGAAEALTEQVFGYAAFVWAGSKRFVPATIIEIDGYY